MSLLDDLKFLHENICQLYQKNYSNSHKISIYLSGVVFNYIGHLDVALSCDLAYFGYNNLKCGVVPYCCSYNEILSIQSVQIGTHTGWFNMIVNDSIR